MRMGLRKSRAELRINRPAFHRKRALEGELQNRPDPHCQTGSGKSSITNALRGIHNSHPEAASIGTSETTTSRATYPAHESLFPITLHDIP